MLCISNVLSFSRGPLAFLFLTDSVKLRFFAVVVSMLTDSVDGHIARKLGETSKLGTILDPTMDKFFAIFAFTVLLQEGRLELWEMLAVLSRDAALIIFTIYLSVNKKWHEYKIGAIIWGKISTTFQFGVLIGLTVGYAFPWYVYASFIPLGILAFFELYKRKIQNEAS